MERNTHHPPVDFPIAKQVSEMSFEGEAINDHPHVLRA